MNAHQRFCMSIMMSLCLQSKQLPPTIRFYLGIILVNLLTILNISVLRNLVYVIVLEADGASRCALCFPPTLNASAAPGEKPKHLYVQSLAW